MAMKQETINTLGALLLLVKDNIVEERIETIKNGFCKGNECKSIVVSVITKEEAKRLKNYVTKMENDEFRRQFNKGNTYYVTSFNVAEDKETHNIILKGIGIEDITYLNELYKIRY